jgi:predicted phosphodiesterase
MSKRTMRILPISDLRLERRKLKEIPTLDQSFDVLVSAGDHWEGEPEKAVQSVVALARGKPSIMVRGNQDVYKGGPEDRRTISDFDRLLRDDAVAEHARKKEILPDELVCTHDGPTVVVTHHPPLAACADAYMDHRLPWWAPAFYASDILPTLPDQIQPDVWICGHVHAPYDAKCGRTCAVCNPVEGMRFNPNLMIEV